MAYIKSKNANARCPVAGILFVLFLVWAFNFIVGFIFDNLFYPLGCPKKLQASKVVCDTLLLVEIDEMRRMSKQSARTDVIEDFTALDDLESEWLATAVNFYRQYQNIEFSVAIPS